MTRQHLGTFTETIVVPLKSQKCHLFCLLNIRPCEKMYSMEEKRELLKQYGFKNSSLINYILSESNHLGEVYNYVQNFAIIALRNLRDNDPKV